MPEALLAEHGPNVLARDQRPEFLLLLWRSVINLLVILLGVLAAVSFSTSDPRAGTVMGASLFIPFLPMLPIQILANNLLYDLGQTTIPTDSVDDDQIQRPRPWNIRALTRFT